MPDLGDIINEGCAASQGDVSPETVQRLRDCMRSTTDGAHTTTRLLAHKIQSPQEKEAMNALILTDKLIATQDPAFHSEVGKFKFLNEVIKIVSPKYLGRYSTQPVKEKAINLLLSWSKQLPKEKKIGDAYEMLRKQGFAATDTPPATQVAPSAAPEVPARPKEASTIEDQENSKLLARLLRSRNPDDLQAANRLIKNMVKQDEQRLDKESKRNQELESVNNNVKLLTEMLENFRKETTTESDQEIIKELHDALESKRGVLARLVNESTDAQSTEATQDILSTSDAVSKVLNMYDDVMVHGNYIAKAPKPSEALLEIDFAATAPPSSSAAASTLAPTTTSAAAPPANLLSTQLASLGIPTLPKAEPPAPAILLNKIQPGDLLGGLDDKGPLDDIFGSISAPTVSTGKPPVASAPSPVLTPSLGGLLSSTPTTTAVNPIARPQTSDTSTTPSPFSAIDALSKELMTQTLGEQKAAGDHSTPEIPAEAPIKLNLKSIATVPLSTVTLGQRFKPLGSESESGAEFFVTLSAASTSAIDVGVASFVLQIVNLSDASITGVTTDIKPENASVVLHCQSLSSTSIDASSLGAGIQHSVSQVVLVDRASVQGLLPVRVSIFCKVRGLSVSLATSFSLSLPAANANASFLTNGDDSFLMPTSAKASSTSASGLLGDTDLLLS